MTTGDQDYTIRATVVPDWRERAEKAEVAETEYFRQYGIQYERAEKAEQERDEALALLRDIDAGVYGMMPTQLNDRIAKLLQETETS